MFEASLWSSCSISYHSLNSSHARYTQLIVFLLITPQTQSRYDKLNSDDQGRDVRIWYNWILEIFNGSGNYHSFPILLSSFLLPSLPFSLASFHPRFLSPCSHLHWPYLISFDQIKKIKKIIIKIEKSIIEKIIFYIILCQNETKWNAYVYCCS